jgi:hypothetical protein
MITTMGTMESTQKNAKAPKPNWIAPIKAEASCVSLKAQV